MAICLLLPFMRIRTVYGLFLFLFRWSLRDMVVDGVGVGIAKNFEFSTGKSELTWGSICADAPLSEVVEKKAQNRW
jgi:hypothetical protein